MSIFDKDSELYAVPPRIKVAIRFLEHARWLTESNGDSTPVRQLTALEQSVEKAALKTLQAYLLGEMDFGDAPPRSVELRDGDDEPGMREERR